MNRELIFPKQNDSNFIFYIVLSILNTHIHEISNYFLFKKYLFKKKYKTLITREGGTLYWPAVASADDDVVLLSENPLKVFKHG